MRSLLLTTLFSVGLTSVVLASDGSADKVSSSLVSEKTTPFTSDSLLRRDDHTCTSTTPCLNGACCGKSGYCGYGSTYCGTNGQSPNDQCYSNCNAKAECGQNAANPGQTCPLNVCCSQFGFCGTTSDFCGNGCQSNCNQPQSPASNGNVQKRIIGYYESWSIGKQCMGMEPNQIPVQSLTHLNYAFAYVHPHTFEVGPMPGTDPKTFSQITDLKQKNGALIVGVSIGGWTFNDNGTDTQPVFSRAVGNKLDRATFVDNVMSFMDNYGFDALDIDWEYPGAPDRGGSGDEVDGDGYVALLRDLKRAMNRSQRKMYLSFTAPTSYWYLRWFPIKVMVDAVDYVNFMTYDLHGTWDSTDPIGSIVLAHTNITEIDLALDLMWRNNIDPSKINLGLAFYSRTFTLQDPSCTTPGCPFKAGGRPGGCTSTSGILSYREISEILASRADLIPTYDHNAGVKYFTYNTDQWAAYDDQQTFQQKIKYANDHGLGGVLIWAVDQDTPNLDALRGVLYPETLTAENPADDVDFWNNQQIGECGTTECGGSCSPGTIEITTVACPSGGDDQKLCCPIASAPDPKTCGWRGNPWFCNGQCIPGEVALASSVDGGNGHCHDGRQFYCCPIPEVADGVGINCGWQDTCRDDQELLTYAGDGVLDYDVGENNVNLRGNDLEQLLGQHPDYNFRRYCCGKKEIQNWKNCYWAGTTHKGFDSCDDNHCRTGHEVELTLSYNGFGQNCIPIFTRQRAFCCEPTSGKSLFLPVPLEDLFPKPPPSNIGSPIFNLETDDTWGTGKEEGKNDPNDASFGFVVITAPDEVHVSLRKRSGSSWEVFGCVDTDSEDPQTVQMLCEDQDSPDSRCNDIHKGYGAVGTIVEMPDGCGPGRYAVVSEMVAAKNQTVPSHLRKRGLYGRRVYDLTFDYDFRRVPRDFGDSQMRVDFSNEEGYWDSVVNRPGETKKKRSEMEDFRQNRKRWLDEQWADAYHHGALSREELHKRWFGASVLSWLAKLVGVAPSVQANKNFEHNIDETLSVILIDEQFGPCPVGPAVAQGNLRATVDAHVQISTNFGLTLIVTLSGNGITLQDSYLYFRNEGEVNVQFTLDAIATLTYTSGDVKMIGLDNFPGATFRVPGIVTVGPNAEVFGRIDAILTLAGHIEAKATIASWAVQQTYPQNDQYPEQTIGTPSQQGTQEIGQQTVSATVSADGEIQMHLKPKVTFGVVFDSRWSVPNTAASLNMDGYIIFYAGATYSLHGDNSCPFTYGLDAGADLFVQIEAPSIYGWGGDQQISLGGLQRKSLVSAQCPTSGSTTKRSIAAPLDFSNDSYIPHRGIDLDPEPGSLEHLNHIYHRGLSKRDTFSIGPIITLPAGFLNCPSSNTDNGTVCPICQASQFSAADGDQPVKRDDNDVESIPAIACPWAGPPSDMACTGSKLSKRANTYKEINLPWETGKHSDFAQYPSCSADNLEPLAKVSKWWLPVLEVPGAQAGCLPEIMKASKDPGEKVKTVKGIPIQGNFANDHVFEVHLVSNFIYWLIGKPPPENHYGKGVIPWGNENSGKQGPFAGWQRPDATWVQNVFGTLPPDGGFLFNYPGSSSQGNWLKNVANFAIGGVGTESLMAVLHDTTNGRKRTFTQAVPYFTGDQNPGLEDAIKTVSQAAAVFDYLNRGVQKPWQTSGMNIEAVCVAFDNAWFALTDDQRSQYGGTAFTRIAPDANGKGPNGVDNWGLRTVWNYWLEQHLDGIDRDIPNWLNYYKGKIQQYIKDNAGSNKLLSAASNFVSQYMQTSGVAGSGRMHFPRTDAYPLLGGGRSATSTNARYGMWSSNYGANGI